VVWGGILPPRKLARWVRGGKSALRNPHARPNPLKAYFFRLSNRCHHRSYFLGSGVVVGGALLASMSRMAMASSESRGMSLRLPVART